MTERAATMLLATRLTGVTFHGRQERLAALCKQGDKMPRRLRHHNNHQEYEGIAIFQGNEDLGWIPKDIAAGLLLPEITASTIRINSIELADIVGGTAEKVNYGAEVVMFLSGDPHTLDILADSINDLQHKATSASVMGVEMKNIAELKESHAKRVKLTSVDDEHKLYIGGDLQLQPNDVRKVLREYSIVDGQYKIENDYYALKNKMDISDKFKYLFFGPTPHSGKGMGDEYSIIAHYQNSSNYIVKQIRNEHGQLKFTASGLRHALDELVIA